MKNLGKILLLLIIVQKSIYASLVANVDYNSVSIGETVTYSIQTSGNDIQRPILDTICNSSVIATSSQTNIEMINGDYKKTKILSYKFIPLKSCEIKPITVVVDGKSEITNSVKVEVKAASQNINADFVIELSTKKTELYVGEPFELVMLIKQRHGTQALDSKFIASKMKGFWKSGEPKQEKYDDGRFSVTKLTYKLSPQREGNLKITPAQLAIATRSHKRDMWGSFMQDLKWKSYFSNELSISVKPIPHGAKFIGDFTINATVDKKEINANEAVNVTIEVYGNGNLEDITKFKPYIKGVSVFDEKPFIRDHRFVEKLALVGDSDFIIPSFTLEFFNPKTKKIQKIATKEIAIKVNGSTPTKVLKIKRDATSSNQSSKSMKEVVVYETSLYMLLFVFFAGLLVGIMIILFKPWEVLKRENSLNLKDEKRLLIKLLPFKDDNEVQDIIDTLEDNIYTKNKKVIDKKLLKVIINKYNIS